MDHYIHHINHAVYKTQASVLCYLKNNTKPCIDLALSWESRMEKKMQAYSVCQQFSMYGLTGGEIVQNQCINLC